MDNIITPAVADQIKAGILILKKGGVIAFPTETVYGIGVSIAAAAAAERIYQIKGRAKLKALPLVLSNVAQVSEVAIDVPDMVWILAERFWPGPLTVIVKKSARVPDSITSGGKTVAIRVSSHPVAVALVAGLGVPITGTSANLSGKPSPVTAVEVFNQLGHTVDLIIDGGKCPGGIESTIIDLTKNPPMIIREGAIPRDVILSVCKVV